ncbi:polyubiquitin-like isoform X2 [Homalodisca vitripennis]|nr:polyubiquitin-like isoform X2 [Homalodisca vitripennis]XP_046659851.1 polyubiquitin-like isoform X2 [Homalodisca vitripennis]
MSHLDEINYLREEINRKNSHIYLLEEANSKLREDVSLARSSSRDNFNEVSYNNQESTPRLNGASAGARDLEYLVFKINILEGTLLKNESVIKDLHKSMEEKINGLLQSSKSKSISEKEMDFDDFKKQLDSKNQEIIKLKEELMEKSQENLEVSKQLMSANSSGKTPLNAQSKKKIKKENGEEIFKLKKRIDELNMDLQSSKQNLRDSEKDLQNKNDIIQSQKRLIDLLQDHRRCFEICIKKLTGNRIFLKVVPSDTVEFVKCMVEYYDGTPVDDIRLIFDGKQLENGRKLSDCNITPGSELGFVHGLRGD